MVMPGKYIVIEGHDGTGKSTQVELLKQYLSEQGIESVTMHEPDGTPIAGAIRDVIKNGELQRDPATNVLLFTASRHEIWKQAKRKLAAGKWVLSARNYLSTLAYQGYGEGVDLDLIIDTTSKFTDQQYMQPDLTVILTLDDEAERNRRISERGILEKPDTFESMNDGFQARVHQAYRTIASQYSLPTISVEESIDLIHQNILKLMHEEQLLPYRL